MTHDTLLSLTPDQLAALDAAPGPVFAHDPVTQRRFMLVEQPAEARLSVDQLRSMLKTGLDQLDRGEGKPWDPEAMKEELRQRFPECGRN